MQHLDTEGLLAAVKRRSLAPMSQRTFQDPDLIAILNEELTGTLAPDLLSARQNFFLRSKLVPIVAGVTRYGITERAIGNALKDVLLVQGTDERSLLQSEYQLEGDEIVLTGEDPPTSGYLKQKYFARTNELVATSACAKITAISSLGGVTTFTVDTDLTSTIPPGTLVDFLNAQSPFLLWGEDVAVSAITSTTIAVASSGVANEVGTVTPGIGDFICIAGTACIPQIPIEFHRVLAQMVVVTLMEGLGDQAKLASSSARLDQMRERAFSTVANRIESSAPVLVNNNGIFSRLMRGS